MTTTLYDSKQRTYGYIGINICVLNYAWFMSICLVDRKNAVGNGFSEHKTFGI